ncbi:ABC transporter permease [Streptomyces rimosus]|uniref:ABC transporter permease n=1 Tax=Streptomyces rimosus TaxID=1927 RepID=UPI0037BD9C32
MRRSGEALRRAHRRRRREPGCGRREDLRAARPDTIKMVCGLLRPDRGSVRIDGRRVRTTGGSAKRLLGYVPQDIALYPDLSVRENLRFFGRLYLSNRRELDRRVREVLELIDLTARADDSAVRQGRTVTVPVLVEPRGTTGYAAASSVSAAVSQHAGRLQAARFAAVETGSDFDRRLETARAQEKATTPIGVKAETAGGSSQFLPLGYSYSTPTMLVLFVFVNCLAFGSAIVRTRRLGVYTRALASPLGPRALVLGETLAYATLAVVQSLLIVGIGALFFDVSWGDPGPPCCWWSSGRW